jgi:hypothetical protein
MEERRPDTAAVTYSYLRGLQMVPVGVLAIVSALANADVGPLGSDWAFLLAVALAGAAWLAIWSHYRDHYGRMTPTPRQHARDAVAAVAAIGVVLLGSLLLRSRVSWSLDLPVNAIAVSFAAMMLITYALGAGVKRHQLIVWGIVLAAGALPVWNGEDPSNVGLAMAGVALIVCGLLDHRLFVGAFGPRHALGEPGGG